MSLVVLRTSFARRACRGVLLMSMAIIVAGCAKKVPPPGDGASEADIPGQKVTLIEGKVEVSLPDGALATPTTLSAVVEKNFPADERIIADTVVTLSPGDIHFLRAVELTIFYDPRKLNGQAERNLRIYKLVDGVWQRVVESDPDPDGNHVHAQITTLGTFAIFGLPVTNITDSGTNNDAALDGSALDAT